MAKEINEKTFELNITAELLNISKAFIYYMLEFPIYHLMTENEWFDFFDSSTFFAEGLTQAQETNPDTGGYDVSINYNSNNGTTGRLLFLQYKSGHLADYCMNGDSQFHGNRFNKKPHIIFHFNDAANNTQHSTLRSLANKPEIQSDSVLYVFPRITRRSELINNNGNLLSKTSFVSVLEIDNQGSQQIPPIHINNDPHKYRTSFDGTISEVNYYYFPFSYNNYIISDIVSELICVQLERYLKILKVNNLERFPLVEYLKDRMDNYFEKYKGISLNKEIIMNYLNQFNTNDSKFKIPKAPEKYTTEIPKEGLKFSLYNQDETDFKNDFETISYQII